MELIHRQEWLRFGHFFGGWEVAKTYGYFVIAYYYLFNDAFNDPLLLVAIKGSIGRSKKRRKER